MHAPINSTVRYTLGVMAQSVSAAVQYAGGLIFDRAAAGWDVTVYTEDDACSIAIEILGAKCRDLESLLHAYASFPTVLVVTASLHAENRRVGAYVAAASAIGAADVMLTGLGGPDDAAAGGGFLYSLGSAASAFKRCAVQAGDLQIETVGGSEHFRRLAARIGAENPVG
ncbi:hypothetical protein [Mycolicibacterium gadium]|uniref:Uncharacterized protein n=2 Tax=Mycolicibacterium gadium TaxID=1794 RepID=A0A7I7WTD5_MYCGU|nr:hypothetical protein [Mycolicibacterium gadium]MDG5481219.1 hypothetical protein [Mycolicibacterium gadium]BBZ20784.1 hypothetical protein MGAD_51190 [Mycolicibacterium gadium]